MASLPTPRNVKSAVQNSRAKITAKKRDKNDSAELRSIEIAHAEAVVEAAYLKNHNALQNTNLRRKFADRTFYYLIAYSLFCALLLLLAGFGVRGFVLAEGVLITIAGSTAVSAIGLVGIVVSGLFGRTGSVD